MIFQHSRSGIIKLGSDALTTMRSFEQHAPDALEAGGLLLGRYLRNGHNIVVDLVTTPQPTDERSRFGFFRSAEPHQRILDEHWERSNGTCVYLGNWHTHAEPDPTPSHIDLTNWTSTLRTDITDNQACFFIIVGTSTIRVWEGDHATLAIGECLRVHG